MSEAIFRMCGDINDEMEIAFVAFANENYAKKWHIILNTYGGSADIIMSLSFLINEHSNDVAISLQMAYSAGFVFLWNVKKVKIILYPASRCMFHYGVSRIGIDSRGKVAYTADVFYKDKVFPHEKKFLLDIAQEVFTKKELRKFKKGDDVYLASDRIKEIFPNSEYSW